MLKVMTRMIKLWGIVGLATVFLTGGFCVAASSASKDIYPQDYSFNLPHAEEWTEADRRLWDAEVEKCGKLDSDINSLIEDLKRNKKAERKVRAKKEVDLERLDSLISEGVRLYGQVDYLKKERTKIDRDLQALWKENNANAKPAKLSPRQIKNGLSQIGTYEKLESKILQEYQRKLNRLRYEMDEVAQKTGDADLGQKLYRDELRRKIKRVGDRLDILRQRKEELAQRSKNNAPKSGKLKPLVFPAGRTISVTATRKKKTANQLGRKGLLKFPKGRTISVTASRKKQRERIAAASVINLSGCWEDEKGRKITLRQDGLKVSAVHSKYGKRVFRGSVKNDKLSLFYVFKDVNDYASIPWEWDDPSRHAPRAILKKALAEQAKHNWGFELTVIDEDELSGEALGHHIAWEEDELTDFRVKIYVTTWRRQKIKLKAVSFTDNTFKKRLSEINSGERFWIKASASSGCKEVVDKALVTVYPKGKESQNVEVKLVETGPDTLEFRSREGIELSAFDVEQGGTIIVRSGLKGSSLKVGFDDIAQGLSSAGVPLDDLQGFGGRASDSKISDFLQSEKQQKLLKEKKQIEAELKKIEDSITQRNLYPDAFGEGFQETLQKEKEHLEEEVLQQMRAKNELLAQYPHADTSDYDKEIKSFKVRLKSVDEQLKDVKSRGNREIKRLKTKKAKLEKRLKAVIKKLKK